MYNSAKIDKEDITKWEMNTYYDRTWKNATNYFEDLIFNIKMYQSNSRGNTKQAQYKISANVR